LEAAQGALARGDRWSVETYLEQLREEPSSKAQLQTNLLEVDLALEFGDHTRARELIQELDPQALPVKLRAARLASESQDPVIAKDLAASILEQAQDRGDEHMIMEALLILGRAQMRLGEMSQGIMTTDKVTNLGRKQATPYHSLSAQVLQGRILMRQGHLERALTTLGGAHQLADRTGFRSLGAMALHNIVNIHYLNGNLLGALECSRQELETWRDLGAPAQEAAALQMLATLECQFGRHQDAIRALEEAQQILELLGDRIQAARNLYHLAATIPYHDESDLGRAIALAGQALEIFRKSQQTRWEASTLRALGYCLWLEGKYAEALEKYEAAYELHDRQGEMSILPEILAYQALALLGLERRDAAAQRSRQALLQLAGLTLENDLISEIYFAHAEVLRSLGDETGAQEYYSTAYQNLLKYAQPIESEEARRAFFERDPTMRRLMRQVYERGIARPPEAGVVERRLQPQIRLGPGAVEVQLTLDAGPADQALKQGQGAIALRRAKLGRIRREAQMQGAAPTVQEMADLLGVSARTVKRDLAALRQAEVR
jgi:tetratricopeptide (TPR) repeat protein